jgi:CheY-like chemotaxis protein/anti-sigma regulatory factor (Ser/Thr protein kinase)
MISVKASSANLAFTIDISKDIPPVINGDEIRIKQVIINLLSNAVKFTKEGCVSLSAAAEKMEDGSLKLHFAVKDTGFGIRDEDIDKLFGEFEQIEADKNRYIQGTGLGLPITRRLIQLMGGRISVESVHGKGSTFSFYIVCEGYQEGSLTSLPEPEQYKVLFYEPNQYHANSIRVMFESLAVSCLIADNEPDFEKNLADDHFTHVFFDQSAEWAVGSSEGKETNFIMVKEVDDIGSMDYPENFINRPMFIVDIVRRLGGDTLIETGKYAKENVRLGEFKTKDVKVLLVDDQPANLIVAGGMLRQYEITVVTASGGQEAIDMVQTDDFDIVFMDHLMPGVDGIEATKAIRGLGGLFSEIPIVALSANAVTGARELFLNAGMNDFLSKPIIISDLHHVLLKFIPPEKVQVK